MTETIETLPGEGASVTGGGPAETNVEAKAPETPTTAPAELFTAEPQPREWTPETAPTDAPELFAGEPASPATINAPPVPADNGKQGCQCEKCRGGSNRDKRGRHHKECCCPICATKKGLPASPGNNGHALPPLSGDVPPAAAGPVVNPFDLSQPTVEPGGKKFEALAGMTFDMGVNGLSMLFGPEWQPQNKDERKMVVDALAKYYAFKGVEDLPPGVLVALVVCVYSAPRLTQNNTRSKLKLGWQWLKVKGGALLARFRKSK